jgi:hypothetical protein
MGIRPAVRKKDEITLLGDRSIQPLQVLPLRKYADALRTASVAFDQLFSLFGRDDKRIIQSRLDSEVDFLVQVLPKRFSTVRERIDQGLGFLIHQ